MALLGQKIVVVMPAYNAELTLERTLDEMPRDIVDHIILVDDNSTDGTVALAEKLGLEAIAHDQNRGYGGNQKTCYDAALKHDADIVAMVHPDYQYTPLILRAMCGLIAEAHYEFVLGSRIIANGALKGGMPKYKYVANRCLTAFQNMCLGNKLSEYHTGYRVYDAKILRDINYEVFSEDFVFDNQMLAEIVVRKYVIGEVSCPTRYFEEASSINFSRSCTYGLGVLGVSVRGLLKRMAGKNSLEFK
ncbi:MAG TPA: glycosyl transferase family 2 [Lentisphaeria bacterium]|nr:glycosyl transferase family 2 [Lentisphaeria bacterium]